MLRKKWKQAGAMLLAFTMLMGAVQFPAAKVDAAGKNLALEATATASSQETADFVAENANDGYTDTRWASSLGSSAWLQLEWSEERTIGSVRIRWERRNVQCYQLQISENGQDWQNIYEQTTYPTETTEEIELNETKTSKYLRLNLETIVEKNPNFNETKWLTASLYEIEVYRTKEIPDERSNAKIIADGITTAPVVSGSKITLPTVPDGASVRFLADYEQVIGEDGTIYQPLKNKTIKGVYEITCEESEDEPEGSVAKTREFTVTVPGKYTDSQNENPKPDVIPELQEWHGSESGNFIAGAGSRIVIGSDDLMDMAKLFAEDYKEITGMSIRIVKGTSDSLRIGDYYFSLTAAKKGLGKEGYTMEIGDTVVTEAEQATGAYWATRTILQILKETGGSIPKGEVKDYPKYEVRGFSLDVGRKPFDLDGMYQFSKNMAWYKMNNFQIHLSDNLIFHEDYPDLETAAEQSYAGFRLESGVINPDTGKSATSEDVYCTKDEFRTFILDSRVMGVNIVPEFDMPAHALPFTRAFPQFMSKRAGGGHSYLIEEVDLEKMDEVIPWVQSIWNDYFEGENPVFDEDVTIHIGTDEYHGTSGQPGKEMFREFSDKMIEFVQGTGRTVRMWGSLSNKSGKTPVRSEGVQLNIWNTGYANPQNMYDLGYDLINTLEGPNYIVPAAGYYNNYINASNIYGDWQPNVIGNLSASAGDDQILGACYAIWHDSVDTRANGISQYDSFDRFFQPVSAYAAKLWGDPQKSYSEFTEIKEKMGTAPGTTIYGELESASSTVVDYTFDGELKEDSGANNFRLQDARNVAQVDTEDGQKSLVLKGGESYLETPSNLNMIGDNAVLTMKVKMDADADGEQILCESKNEFGTYGTYAFKASQKNTGKVGYSREGYDFSFDYTLPKDGTWHILEFRSGKDTVSLYVDGALVDNNPDIYFANHPTTELSAKLSSHSITKTATMLVPMGRIGSKTNSFKGQIEYVTVTKGQRISGNIGRISQAGWTSEACSYHSEGPVGNAHDGNSTTYWHQNYSNDTTVSDEQPHWYEVTLPTATNINQLIYLPRQNSENGRILEYGIEVTKEDGTKEMVVERGTWADTSEQKAAAFSTIRAKKVKLLMYKTKSNHATIGELNLGYADLSQILSGCEGYASQDYASASWTAFAKAKEFAEKIAEEDNSDGEIVVYACEQLQQAKEQLVAMPSELRERYALSEALNEAEKELEDMDADSEYAASLIEAIADAEEALQSADGTTALTTLATNLQTTTQKAVLESVVASAGKIETSDATQAASLQAALAAAKKALESGTTTVEEFKGQVLQVQLSARRAEVTDELNAAKNKLDSVDQDDYLTTSVVSFMLAIERAEDLLADENASIEDLASVLTRLQGVSLVVKPEKGEAKANLSTAISNAEKNVVDTTYTQKSRDALLAALNAAKTVIAKGDDATIKELTNALNAIKDVMLVKEQPVTPPNDTALTANTEYPLGGVVYKTTDKTDEVILQKGEDTSKVTIDGTVKINETECKIVGIADQAFKGYKSLKTVVIGDNVTSIGQQAFSGCKKLSSVTIGKGVATIGKKAFYNSKKLKTLVVKSQSLKKLPKDAFKNTKSGITVNVKAIKSKKRKAVFNLIKKAGAKKPKMKVK